MDLLALVKEHEAELIAIRRHLHAHPELPGEEWQTLAFIKEKLECYGIGEVVEVENGGILAFIRGDKPGKTVLLRADIDALPVQESECTLNGTKKHTVSEVAGVTHACGHDAHTAMLLIAGKVLNQIRDQIEGTVLLCFERGEEGPFLVGFILKYLRDHKIAVDGCYGQHVSNMEPAGALVVQPGNMMAGISSFNVTISGTGGHGSRPDEANSPIDCFAAIVSGMNSLRMRSVNPFEVLTWSIGYVNAGIANNVIPPSLKFGGTIRYYDEAKALQPFYKQLKRLWDDSGKAYGVKVEYPELPVNLPLVNNEDCTRIAYNAFADVFGKKSLTTMQPLMGSESFAYVLSQYPGVFAMFNTGSKKLGNYGTSHVPEFDVVEEVLYRGSAAHIAYALAFLKNKEAISFKKHPSSLEELFRRSGHPID